MELFQKLGGEIEDLWRKENYKEDLFPSIAAKALAGAALPGRVSAWDVIEWTLNQTELPRQKDPHANFGDPPITLYVGPRFHIDVYFWLEGTTAIHQHAFCGAFQVLLGSSIHSWYEFERAEAINSLTELGKMNLKTCELLEVGNIQEIRAGRQYIHSLFHLDQPSVTIVVRTDKSPMYLPQYSYLKPNLAIDPFFEQETTTKKLQAITALIRAKHPETDRIIAELLEKSDFQTTYLILNTVNSYLRSNQIGQMFNLSEPKARFEKFLEITRKRHGERADVFAAVFAYNNRLSEIVRRRSYVTEPEHRFFLALLLNVDGKERICSLIKQRFPDADPIEKMLDWTFDLSQMRVAGLGMQNALGIAEFDDFDLFIFEKLLKDETNANMIEAVKRDYPPEKSETLLPGLAARIVKIRESAIFGTLFERENS